MIPGPGPIELLIIAIIGLWKVGLPLAVAYFFWRMWQRMARIEDQLQEMKTQRTQR